MSDSFLEPCQHSAGCRRSAADSVVARHGSSDGKPRDAARGAQSPGGPFVTGARAGLRGIIHGRRAGRPSGGPRRSRPRSPDRDAPRRRPGHELRPAVKIQFSRTGFRRACFRFQWWKLTILSYLPFLLIFPVCAACSFWWVSQYISGAR